MDFTMPKNFAPLLLLIFTGVAVATACGQPETTPTPKPEVVNLHVPLTDQENAVAIVSASRNDNMQVKVEVTQEADIYRTCGKPSVRDVFGNTMADLSSVVHSAGLRIYQFALTVPVDGQYGVIFDSSECAVAQVETTAVVT